MREMSAITQLGSSTVSVGDEVVPGQERLELATEEKVDPRPAGSSPRAGMYSNDCKIRSRRPGDAELFHERLSADASQARFFEAHGELELAWRAAPTEERDIFRASCTSRWRGTRHGAGRPVACASQLGKARRRLAPYSPEHRGVDVAGVLAQVEAADELVAAGSLALPDLRI